MRNISFTQNAEAHYVQWKSVNVRIFNKITTLIEVAADAQYPNEGIGNPHKLTGDYRGYWSRKIDKEHRLVYSVSADKIHIISCKFHYPV